MIHSDVCDEETKELLIRSHLMKEYHLGLKDIENLPSDLATFILLKDDEISKKQKKKLKEQEKKLNKITRRQRIY